YYSAYNSNYAPSQLGDGTRPIGYELNVGIPKTFKELKPFEEGKSVPYGEKQMAFIIKWMQNQSKWSQFIDSSKVYFQGGSLGGGGSMTFALHYPELVSAIDAIQGKVVNYFIDPSTGAGSYPGGMENYLGPFSENIPTPEGIGIYDYVDAGKYFLAHPEKDFPVIRTNHGKNDLLAWYQVPAFYSAANSARVYIYSVFDQCAHNCFEASYFPEYIPVRNFVVNMFNDGFNIFHYSLSKSYPAFSDFSLNSNPGNGVPASGDLRGGINRYPYWDWNTGLETSRQYDVNVFLMAESPLDSATVSITPRRLQALEHSAGTAYFWKNIRVSDGQVLQSGNVSADQYGRITIQNFIISKQKSTLSMVVGNSPPAQCFDLTGDNKVDLFDLVFVSLRLGSPAGSPADVIGNDGVNILDLQEVSRNFGQNC
ncbi:MAG: hypothetical protein Q7R70_02215, partial [Candidatus Diapherotrites archaeon]|nr:hypothetical protein [Candidatus Diapherotrites archaeon]